MSKTFEVRVTNTEDDNDLSTIEVERSSDDDTAEDIMDLLNTELGRELKFTHNGKFIEIFEASDGEGYIYNIYDSEEDCEEGNDVYGGQCTGTLSNAIEMALSK